MKQAIKIKEKREFFEALCAFITTLIENKSNQITDEDKLLMAVLFSIKEKLDIKLCRFNNEYSFKLQAEQALALRIMCISYMVGNFKQTDYLFIKTLTISNKIHQFFS